jgi:hypothetical protein
MPTTVKQVLLLISFALLAAAPPAAAADEPRAGDSAVALLASLGATLDEGALGVNEWTIYRGPNPFGEARLSVESRLADGLPAYGVTMKLRLNFESGSAMELTATALVTPDLRTLTSESVERQTRETETRSRVIRTSRTGDEITVTRIIGDETKQWRLKAPAGLIDSGAEPLLLRILARRGVAEGAFAFVTRAEGTLLPLHVKAGGRTEADVGADRQAAVTYTTSTVQFDSAMGRPAAGPDGRLRPETRRYAVTPGGEILVWETSDPPVRFERRTPAPGPGSPILVVSQFFRALAARDAAAVSALFDWDAVFAAWRAGPGAAEVEGRPPEEVAALRADLPGRLTKVLIDNATDRQRPSFLLLAEPAVWVERRRPDGTLEVSIPEARRQGDPGLSTLRFRLRRPAEGPALILEIPGM